MKKSSGFNHFSFFTVALVVLTLTTGKSYGAISSAVMGQFEENVPSISITGEGKAETSANLAKIQAAVVSLATYVDEAMAQNAEIVENVLETLKDLGLTEQDIQTSNLNVSPKSIGYMVSQDIVVSVRDFDKIEEFVSTMVRNGTNRLSRIDFTVEDLEALQNRAYELAMKDAINRANLYVSVAQEMGLPVTLGVPLSISERRGSHDNMTRRLEIGYANDGSDTTPPPIMIPIVIPESISYSANVSVVFKLEE